MAADPKETSPKEEATEVVTTESEVTATAVEEPAAVAGKPETPAAKAVAKLGAEALIREFEAAQLKSELPDIYVGDTVRVIS